MSPLAQANYAIRIQFQRRILTPSCSKGRRRFLKTLSNDSLLQSLCSHLAWWGLQRFTSDADYFAWQRKHLSPADLTQLHTQVERKRGGARGDEVAFYDLTAQPHILPVLYSQRYEYYCEIGLRVAA